MKISVILSLFNCEKYLEEYFNNALRQVNISDIEFSIIHNNPTNTELLIIERFKDRLNIKHAIVPLEPLYVSWNKAIGQSTGEYLVCWNVDDLRVADSISKMATTLDNNPTKGFTYGDFKISKSFGQLKGRYVSAPEFNFWKGTTGAIGGPFFMWRRSLIKTVGFFDEQFKSGGDFDYTVRLSIFTEGIKTQGLLGYFLNDNTGLSTKSSSIQILERTVIERRYGIWHKTFFYKLKELDNYDLFHFTKNGKKVKINNRILELRNKRRFLVFFSFFATLKNWLISSLRFIKRRLLNKPK